MHILKNKEVSISFNDRGEVFSIKNILSDRELMIGSSYPFEVWTDVYGFLDQDPKEPDEFFRRKLAFDFTGCEVSENNMALTYSCDEALVTIGVKITGYEIGFTMELKKKVPSENVFLPVFPKIDGIDMDEEKGAKMLVMSKAGYVDKCWSARGGFYGNSRQMSAQFGCLFDDSTCFGILIKDQKFRGKDISYQKPCFEIRWVSEDRLGEGETLVLPETSFLVYSGSWFTTAEAYGDWFRATTNPDPVPKWVMEDSTYNAAFFSSGSYKDMWHMYITDPVTSRELACFCRRSGQTSDVTDGIHLPCGYLSKDGVWKRHTDGWNEIREDLGGAEAMRQGIEKIHKMGQHFTLYVEFYIVPMESELYEHKPEAIYWTTYDSKHQRMTIYQNEYYFHMCPGTGWADHMAEMVARLIRETGCDGVRLDSCGSRFAPCYSKHHPHESPYDYNKWTYDLIEKVAKAARAVNPDIHLSTEHPVDYFAIHLNSALYNYGLKEGPAPLSVALPHYRLISTNGGSVAQAANVLPSSSSLYTPWIEARQSVEHIFHYGKLLDDIKPQGDDEICRHLSLDGEDLIIFIKPDMDERTPGEPYLPKNQKNFISSIVCPLDYIPKEAFKINAIDGSVSKTTCYYDGQVLRIENNSPFALFLIRRDVGDAILNIEAKNISDKEIELSIDTPSNTVSSPIPAKINIPGLFEYEGFDGIDITVPGKVTVKFPDNCLNGKYRVNFSGDGIVSALKIVDVGTTIDNSQNTENYEG